MEPSTYTGGPAQLVLTASIARRYYVDGRSKVEIADEFDPGYEPMQKIGDHLFEVDGRLSLLDLLDRLDVDKSVLSDVEAESVGGLISDVLERIPTVGDRVEVGHLRFDVKSMDGYRVAIAHVERLRDDATEWEGAQQAAEEAEA